MAPVNYSRERPCLSAAYPSVGRQSRGCCLTCASVRKSSVDMPAQAFGIYTPNVSAGFLLVDQLFRSYSHFAARFVSTPEQQQLVAAGLLSFRARVGRAYRTSVPPCQIWLAPETSQPQV
ncbi:hypothetical protein BS78_02G022100 [Paspalum vaginatum]|nr:hypothetical protein BS78_02G022100 [Paspalum vaginatum]